VLVDRDILKNALAVGIPKSGGQKGIAIAAAMAVLLPGAEGQEKTSSRHSRVRPAQGPALVSKVRIGWWTTGSSARTSTSRPR